MFTPKLRTIQLDGTYIFTLHVDEHGHVTITAQKVEIEDELDIPIIDDDWEQSKWEEE